MANTWFLSSQLLNLNHVSHLTKDIFKKQIVLVPTRHPPPQVSDPFRYRPWWQLNVSFIVLEKQVGGFPNLQHYFLSTFIYLTRLHKGRKDFISLSMKTNKHSQWTPRPYHRGCNPSLFTKLQESVCLDLSSPGIVRSLCTVPRCFTILYTGSGCWTQILMFAR